MTRLLLTLSALVISGQAMAADGKCLLVVKGKTFINGPCKIDKYQGSIMLNTGAGEMPSPYFLYLNELPNGGHEASWNADPQSTHAGQSLGEDFKFKAGCWVGKLAKICAWPARH